VDRRISGTNAERVLKSERKRSAAWGREPVGGWTLEQTKRWEQDQEASEAAAAAMEGRANKAVKGFQKYPEAVSKKTEGGHQKDGSEARPQAGGKVCGTGSGLSTGEPGDEELGDPP
jgi:hypothetical protein